MRTLSVLTLFAGTLALTGCDLEIGDFNGEKFKQDFRYSYALKSGGTFSLESMNGSVDISGWDRDEVEITGVKYAETEALRDSIKIDITHSDQAASVRTIGPFENHHGAGARYIIRLPRKATLDRIVTSNGKVHVSDIDGAVRLKTSNGSVQLAKVMGNVDAQSSNGSIEVSQVNGSAHLHTSNSRISAESVKGPVEATSSNGSITLTMSEGIGGEVHASTSNSSITAKLPANSSARLRASTSNSNISSDFSVESGNREERRHLEGAIGNGGSSSPLVDLSTSNGSIHIEKL